MATAGTNGVKHISQLSSTMCLQYSQHFESKYRGIVIVIPCQILLFWIKNRWVFYKLSWPKKGEGSTIISILITHTQKKSCKEISFGEKTRALEKIQFPLLWAIFLVTWSYKKKNLLNITTFVYNISWNIITEYNMHPTRHFINPLLWTLQISY